MQDGKPAHDGIERRIGKRIRERIGPDVGDAVGEAGAFGEVWAARAPDGSSVALKFIDSHKRDGALIRGEIRILRALSEVGHPNLIRLLGVHFSSPIFLMR